MHCGRFDHYSTRRDFLKKAGAGFGAIGLAGVLGQSGLLAEESRLPHFAPKAKSVIWLFMRGGPSAVDMFHPKPELTRRDGMKFDTDVGAFFGNPGPLMKSPFAISQHGQSGGWVCEHYSQIAKHVDKLAFIHSCHAESNNHTPATLQMNCGLIRVGFPSAGSWVTYGLGSENKDLPGFVVMFDKASAPEGTNNWSPGFLPTEYEATIFRPDTTPVLNLDRPDGVTQESQRAQLDYLAGLNKEHMDERAGDAALAGRIKNFELAYRMQMTAPEALDISSESEQIRKLYGIHETHTKSFGSQCLMARRLVERGVRFVQLYHGGTELWDAHGNLAVNHRTRMGETDVPIAGLLTDLEQRGMLEDTLVIWGGEFGRLPVSQDNAGRDHNPHGFTMWFAGGGVKGGVNFGSTDEVGFKAAENPVSIHDLHATILHLLGLDHKKLTYFHNGRRYRLTDVSGDVVKAILA
jgi:hypothetical protein